MQTTFMRDMILRKIIFSMVLVLSLFLKAFEARIQSEETPVQGESQIDLFKRFFVAISPETDYECEEELKKLKADAMVPIDSGTNPVTIRVGDPFFLVKNGSKIVKGTLIKFFSSCEFGRVGLLRLKEKIIWTTRGNWDVLAFAQKKPSPDVMGSVTHLKIDEKLAIQYLSIIDPHMPKHYGDVSLSAVKIFPPRSSDEYLFVAATFYKTKEVYGDDRSYKFSGFLFRHGIKEMVFMEQIPGLISINGITDLDRDGIYEVLVLVHPDNKNPEAQMRLFNGNALSESKRVMATFVPL